MIGGEFSLIHGVNASVPLAHNASAADVAEAINNINDWVGVILVEREELSEYTDNQGDMFEWRMTFPPEEGDVPQLRVSVLPYFFHVAS